MYRKVEESQTLLINTQSQILASQNREIVKFGFGQSPFLPPLSVMEAFKDSVDRKEYSPVQGDTELRQLISGFHRDHNGLTADPANILVAPGSKILIYSILLAFEHADVFIPAPAWVSYAPQVQLAGHHMIKIESDFIGRWRITPESLVKSLKNKRHEVSIMILNYPGNPDGLTYTEEELKQIAHCARERDILVISDEIYGLLDHNDNHLSFSKYYPEKTITTTGLSKWCGAGGWRLGVALLYDGIEPAFKQTLIGIGSETYSCAPTPVQHAAKAAYSSYVQMSPYLRWQISILKQIGNYCSDRLNATGIKVHSPEGGFYLFPDFSNFHDQLRNRGINTSVELCNAILKETGVALLPASAFGFEETYFGARLAYVDFVPPAEQGDFYLESGCPKVKKGIDLLTKWAKAL